MSGNTFSIRQGHGLKGEPDSLLLSAVRGSCCGGGAQTETQTDTVWYSPLVLSELGHVRLSELGEGDV